MIVPFEGSNEVDSSFIFTNGLQDFGKRLERDLRKSVDARLRVTEALSGQTVRLSILCKIFYVVKLFPYASTLLITKCVLFFFNVIVEKFRKNWKNREQMQAPQHSKPHHSLTGSKINYKRPDRKQSVFL